MAVRGDVARAEALGLDQLGAELVALVGQARLVVDPVAAGGERQDVEVAHVRDRQEYWGEVEFPYTPYYAYVEVLAPFLEASRSSHSVLTAAERLTARITGGEVTTAVMPAEKDRQAGLTAFLHTAAYCLTEVITEAS